MTQIQLETWLFTLGCELPVIVLLAWPRPIIRVLLVASGASILTRPLGWYVLSMCSLDTYLAGIFWIEVCTVLLQAFWYQYWINISYGRSLWWAFLANMMTVVAGFGWAMSN